MTVDSINYVSQFLEWPYEMNETRSSIKHPQNDPTVGYRKVQSRDSFVSRGNHSRGQSTMFFYFLI